MTTINTIEDLIRLLDENPEWLEALRARLLTRELLELPQNFAKFVESTNNRFDRELLELPQNFAKFVESTNNRFEAMQKEMRDGFQSVRRDMGVLKGSHARNSALARSYTIARNVGLNQVEYLTDRDLWDITDSSDTSDIPANQIDSFRLADLVMKATDSAGETCYIAVEISYTANGRDTERAVRNAAFLTRFTGKPAYAVAAGVFRDNRIEPQIESGEVFWSQLEAEDLEVE